MNIKKIISKDIVILFLSTFCFFSSYQLLLPTFPLYVEYLGGNEKIIGFLTGLYTLAAIFFRPFFGKLSDTKGRKIVLYIGSFVIVTAPIFYIFEFGFIYLTIVRIYHSISVAAFITASQILLGDYSKPETRGILVGIYGIVITCSVAIASPIAFKIVNLAGFPALFYTTSLMGVILFCFVKLLKAPDYTNSNENEIATSYRELLKNKAVLFSNIIILLVTIANGAINTFLPLHGVNVGIQNIGIYFTMFAISSIIIRLASGYLSDRNGRKVLVKPGLIVLALGLLSFTKLPSYAMLIIGSLMVGLGFSTVHTLLLALVIDETSPEERARSISLFNNSYDLGMTIGAMGLGGIAAYSYSKLWLVVALIIFIGCIFTVESSQSSS